MINLQVDSPLSFKEKLSTELDTYLQTEVEKYPVDDLLKIDLHCHDYNSDKPDELLGRILNVPETWLKSERLLEVLEKNGCDAFCITNHNNARSCYEMQEKGYDILNGAEFTCIIPEYDIFIHVLTYGFTPKQEEKLNAIRHNLYRFLEYCKAEDLPTIWAHPLYNYYAKKMPDLDFFFKISLLFERFEVLNGQRETWQNLLVKNWIESLTPSKIDELAIKYNLNLAKYTNNPYKKSFSGGSDSHMGIFSGLTGSYLYVPNLRKRLKDTPSSQLALEAIKAGNMIPYGSYTRHEKLTIAFLDYFCQIAMHYKDPGFMRIALHKGTLKDKMFSYFLSNVVSELQHHKTTMKFIKLFRASIQGNAPGYVKKFLVSKAYKNVFDDLTEMASVNNKNAVTLPEDYHKVLHNIYGKLNNLFLTRFGSKVETILENASENDIDINHFIEQIDLPSTFRDIIDKPAKSHRADQVDIVDFLDGLSFPFLSSSIILAANYTSAKVLFNHRELLNSFADHLGKLQHPKRMIWLTDTFDDKNGVSVVLQSIHAEIKKYNLPIDIVVCSNTVQPDDHLLVLKPVLEMKNPLYESQPIRVPDFMQLHALFDANEYDRIMCSTEGPMGLGALYLKNAFSVKAYFYMHTDWLNYARQALNVKGENYGRAQRALRAYYGMFDNVFVLNTEHREWLTGPKMNLDIDRVSLTAHWIEDYFKPLEVNKKEVFNLKKSDQVILYVGRISREKGVLKIPKLFEKMKKKTENLKMVFVGSGPAEKELQEKMPEATFIQWVDHKNLPAIYSAADLLIFPSKFDTFSCVVLEAMSCGLPVLAYNTKGPRDIIEHKKSGLLANSKTEFINYVIDYFSNPDLMDAYKAAAIERAKQYNRLTIFNKLLADVNLDAINEKSA